MRDIIFVTVDSLRADHVGWHGYNRDTTPNLDSRAAEGRMFAQTFSHACSTRPSFPSILTSSYALMYGGFQRLSQKRKPLAEALSDAGYETAGFHSNLYLSADFGYDRGFDEFFDSKSNPSPSAKVRQFVKQRLDSDGFLYSVLQKAFNATETRAGIEVGSAYVDAADITDRALEWALKTTGEHPRFLWVHYMDVHHPYVPPERFQTRFRESKVDERKAIQLRRKMLESPSEISDEELKTIIDLYDAEISYVDQEVERLLATLEDEWGDDLGFFFTADHGEEFLDHGRFSHAATFFDEVLHVPFITNVNEIQEDSEILTGLLDIAPTIVDYATTEVPDEFYGYSLLESTQNEWPRQTVVAEWADTESEDQRFAVRTADWKYILLENGEERLFDLDSDPGETENLIDDDPSVLQNLRARLKSHRRQIDETVEEFGTVEMDEETRQRLRDLGYRE